MPSLNNLEKFRNLFRNVGNEAQDLTSKGLSFADFPLPDVVDANAVAEHETTQQDVDNAPDFNIDSLFGDSSDQFDISDDFDIDNLFADEPITESANDTANADNTTSLAESAEGLSSFNIGDIPETLADIPNLDGVPFVQDGEADIPSAEGDAAQDDLSFDDLPSLDDAFTQGDGADAPSAEGDAAQDDLSFDDLPSLDDAFTQGDGADAPSAEGDEAQDGFSLDDLPSLDDAFAQGDGVDAPNAEGGAAQDGFSLDDLPSLDDAFVQGDGADAPSAEGDAAQDGFSLDDLPSLDEPTSDTPSVDDSHASGLDGDSANESVVDYPDASGDVDGADAASDAIAMDGDEPPPLDVLFDDLIIPGLDVDDVTAGKHGKAGGEKQEFAVSDGIEEINLTEEEYEHLKNSLASLPLNLRIICEELIAEQAVAPELMSRLIKLLVKEAPIQEIVDLAGKIQGRIINIPKSFEKKSGEELEAEKSSFLYLFIHKFLPIFGWTLFVGAVIVSLFYLGYRFFWIPLYAESIYKDGYKRIGEGQYEDANVKFNQALKLHAVKKWFPMYAEAFIAKRQYIHAEKKYEDLLRYYPKEKQGALDYASLETNILQNYEKADSILRKYILDFNVKDKDALLAIGDNALLWGEIDQSKYETAREAYAQYIENYGQSPQTLERMLKYFIRTDNLKETLPLKDYFTNPEMKKKRNISPETLTELAGYLFDKQFSETEGVPDEYITSITGVRDLLLDAAEKGPDIPEAHYNLSRYYHYFNNTVYERSALERALPLFDFAPETSNRLKKRIDAERRYAQVLIRNKEFFASEEHLQKGVRLYEDGLARNLFVPSPYLSSLYADMGDLDYFTKENDWDMALEYYRRAERGGWKPPEILYRMGAAFYHQEKLAEAQEKFVDAAAELPFNRRILNTMGNISFLRGDYFAAEGYYSKLLKALNEDKARFPELSPQTRQDHYSLVERLMVVQNNMGVVMEALAERTGNPSYKDRALSHYVDSQRAWDSFTRNPTTFVRAGVTDVSTPGVNLAYINLQNALSPQPEFEPQIYMEIDKDVIEPSEWERLAPSTARLAEPLN